MVFDGSSVLKAFKGHDSGKVSAGSRVNHRRCAGSNEKLVIFYGKFFVLGISSRDSFS